MIASPHRLDFTPQQQLVSRSQKETSRVSESEDDVMMNGNEFDKTNEYEDEAEDFRPDGTVLELHGGKQGLSLTLYNVKREFKIPGALEEGVVRASVADGENYTTSIFSIRRSARRWRRTSPWGRPMQSSLCTLMSSSRQHTASTSWSMRTWA